MDPVFDILTPEHREIARRYVPDLRHPDLTLAPDGRPYLYRWHVIKGAEANTYLHMQVADDPERPLHDHPWDNVSVILAGGYNELVQEHPPNGREAYFTRTAGQVVYRDAEAAHQLFMLDGHKYTLTQFSTGPKIRDWGFWYPGRGWVCNYEVVKFIRPDFCIQGKGD